MPHLRFHTLVQLMDVHHAKANVTRIRHNKLWLKIACVAICSTFLRLRGLIVDMRIKIWIRFAYASIISRTLDRMFNICFKSGSLLSGWFVQHFDRQGQIESCKCDRVSNSDHGYIIFTATLGLVTYVTVNMIDGMRYYCVLVSV